MLFNSTRRQLIQRRKRKRSWVGLRKDVHKNKNLNALLDFVSNRFSVRGNSEFSLAFSAYLKNNFFYITVWCFFCFEASWRLVSNVLSGLPFHLLCDDRTLKSKFCYETYLFTSRRICEAVPEKKHFLESFSLFLSWEKRFLRRTFKDGFWRMCFTFS